MSKGTHIKLVDIPHTIQDDEQNSFLKEEYKNSSFFKKILMWFRYNPIYDINGKCRIHWLDMPNIRKHNPDHIAIINGTYVVNDGWRIVSFNGNEHSNISLVLERDVDTDNPYR